MMTVDTENLRLRLQSRLIELGINKSQLCRKIGKNPGWLGDVLRGKARLTEETIQQLSDALDVPHSFFGPEIHQLLIGPESPQEPQEAASTTPGT